MSLTKAKDLCGEISDIYLDEYPYAINKLRDYITILVMDIENDKFLSINERVHILDFLIKNFEVYIYLFLDFIKSLDVNNGIETIDFVEEKMREILNYDGKSIKK